MRTLGKGWSICCIPVPCHVLFSASFSCFNTNQATCSSPGHIDYWGVCSSGCLFFWVEICFVCLVLISILLCFCFNVIFVFLGVWIFNYEFSQASIGILFPLDYSRKLLLPVLFSIIQLFYTVLFFAFLLCREPGIL